MVSVVKLREDARSIYDAALRAVNPVDAVKKHLTLEGDMLRLSSGLSGGAYDLSRYEKIYVIGAGKAACSMARAVEEVLGDRITGGVVNVKYGHTLELDRIRVNEGAHPVPDIAGLRAAEEVVGLLETVADERTLVVCLISGGGSALLPSPVEGVSLEDKQALTETLLASGATIQEINAIRKHVSKTKGGGLARFAYPSTMITLVLSDVIGDDLAAISSGPTVGDTTTYGDCLNIIKRYSLGNKVPESIVSHLERGARGEVEETPGPGDPVFERTKTIVIGSNLMAALAARDEAASLGYDVLVLSTSIEGETREAAKFHSAVAKEIRSSGNPLKPPACVVSGGETTVSIKGTGVGGRNQEFALAAAIGIAGMERVVIMSAGTDGTDGPTEAAGALADGATTARGSALGMDAGDYLERNDSYSFFHPLGDLVVTGPTHTNVMDIRLVLVG